jgi:hypothetical protein
MLPRLIGIVKQNLSRAKRRRNGRGEDGGVGQGAAVPCPTSTRSDPEREQQSELRISNMKLLDADNQRYVGSGAPSQGSYRGEAVSP